MSTLLIMALLLAFISAWLEFKLLKTVPGLRWLNRKSALLGLGISLALSWLIGLMFGAAGLVVLIAGLLSTFMTEPIHAFHRNASARKDQITQGYREFRATYHWVWTATKWSAIVATSPIWIPVKIHMWYRRRNGTYANI